MNLTYVLITPARNEAAFIEKTIRSVIGQTVLPLKWIIVNDGSTDATDDIVRSYLPHNPWMELIQKPKRQQRHFAGKVHAFNAGYERVHALPFDIIGNLDADISFDQDHFEFLLERFAQMPDLGVAGTPFREGDSQYNYHFSRKEHVSGACQLFRRTCFEQIGGYIPLQSGGVDLAAVVIARMKGWKTVTFDEKFCIHHRMLGTGATNRLIAAFKSGYGDYPMGVHPLWQVLRSVYQMSRRPYILGGGLLLLGYCWAVMSRAKSPVSKEFIQFRRNEQMNWLKQYVLRILPSTPAFRTRNIRKSKI